MNNTAVISCMFLIVGGLLTLLAGIVTGSTALAAFGSLACLGGYCCQPQDQPTNRNSSPTNHA